MSSNGYKSSAQQHHVNGRLTDRIVGMMDKLQNTSHILSNVIMAMMHPDRPVNHLTASEMVLVKVIRNCTKNHWTQLTTIVFQMPVINRDDFQTVMDVVSAAHADGNMNWGRLCATMAFLCMYVKYMMEDTQQTADVFAHMLSSFYMTNYMPWLLNIGGLSQGVKRKFPLYWMLYKIKSIVNVF